MDPTTQMRDVDTNYQTGSATATLLRLEDIVTSSNNSSLNGTSISTILDSTSDNITVPYKLYLAYNVWYFIIDAILLLPTVFGNSLVILSLIRYKSLRKIKAFILIGNLAVSDLLVGCVVLPMDLVLIFSPLDSNERTLCLWFYCAVYTLVTASVLNLLLISLERFHAIIRPFQHNATVTTKRIYLIMCITWIFVLIIGSLPQIFWRKIMNDITGPCRNNIMFESTYKLVMTAIIVTALVTSFVLFIVVIRIAITKSKQKPLSTTGAVNAANGLGNVVKGRVHNLRRDIRHTRLMIIVSGTFIVCWAPYCILSIIPSKKAAEIAFLRNWLASLGLINSCLNWIVYAARNSKFRAAFKSILNCSCRHRGEINIASSTS